GKSIIEGLGKGIDDASGGLFTKAWNMAQDIRKTFSSALQINSPSKVMIPIGSAVPEGVGVGMDRGNKFVVDAARNAVGNVKKQMSNMPSVYDFAFQTSQYSVPDDALNSLTNYMQPNVAPNNLSTTKKVFSNRQPEAKELNLTVNMTNMLDGKELAGGTYMYTTDLQDRAQQRREQF
ncbi:hypothetical protein, partial [Streptomyces sp. NPDC093554]|uniref:phage tail protein n=1 Tax=Streptomyces sp. NPDC093554 TaxID=3155074 RepID=UPI00344B5148